MSRWASYVRKAAEVINGYDGGTPLAPYLKTFFKEHKQMGATDRRYVSGLTYAYYRLGHAVKDWPVEEKIITAWFLCQQQEDILIGHLRPKWRSMCTKNTADKLAFLQLSMTAADIFPWMQYLSGMANSAAFAFSHLVQPDLFIRPRPGYHDKITRILQTNQIPFQERDAAIALPNNTALNELLQLNKAYVVQDYSSQQVAPYLQEAFHISGKPTPSLWDCCAASGGKSILAYDLQPRLRLTVSDVRSSIIHNLRQRFGEAGIMQYQFFIADLTQLPPNQLKRQYDVILADVPCSGAGTWSRTPEQLYFFKEERIDDYAQLQRQILQQVIRCMKPGGLLVFVTCSVFKKENEDNVQFLQQAGLNLLRSALLEGYDKKADTMFAALLQAP